MYCTLLVYFRHHSSRPMLSHAEPRRRCECECVIHVSVHIYVLVMSISVSIFLFYICYVCCMLEYLYVCCVCVLIIPLVTRAWHVGNPRHVACRVYIDMHLGVCVLCSCHVNLSYLSFNLIRVFWFNVSMSLFGHVVCFTMWSVFDLWSNFCQSQNFLIFQMVSIFSSYDVFASLGCLFSQF